VGSFLSSGIDSSYLAACLAQENPDIQTFTVGFAEYEGERDEVSWAHELAQQLHVSNDSKHIGEDEFWDAVPTVQWHMDEPSADPSAVALYFVDQLAARHVKAVLSGEGADEFFGGYRVYQAPLAANHANVVPKPLLRAGSKVLRATGMRGANYLERASERVEDWYYTNANSVAFSPDERDRILAVNVRSRLARMEHSEDTRDLIGLDADRQETEGVDEMARITGIPAPQQLTAPVYNEVAASDEVSRMQYVDLWFWLVGDILLKTDKMSMAHSLESRVPFLDREVFALSATIPPRQKVTEGQTKVTLRAAAERAIPRDWAQKEKLGFPVPVASWLREGKRYNQVKDAFTSNAAKRYFDTHELVRLLDEHRDGLADNSRRIWIVYSFLVWYQVYFAK
jgi:asparagine synthase (glutamine-hydrolysing)